MLRANLASLTLALLLIVLSQSAAAEQVDVSIRQYLEGLDAGDAPWVAGRTLNEPDLVVRVYRERNHAPLWVANGELGAGIDDLLSAIGQSVAHGFPAERYHRPTIESLRASEDPASTLALELLATDAFLSQALHRGRGAVSPPNLDAEWQLPPAEVDAAALLFDIAAGESALVETLDRLWPTADEYWLLVRRRADIAASAEETTVQIAPGPLIRPGETSDRVLLLKQRLMGPGDHGREYDEDLRREVIAFQRSAGLEADGIVGDNTLEILNATRVSWLDRIDANLERWRWLPRETPDTYLRVNIAAFTLRGFEDGRQTLGMDVIVGRPYRRTPVFTESIKYLVLNPYWNVPYSIATKDKLPLLKANAAAEAAKGFEARPQGSESFLAVDAVDWSNVSGRTFNFLLRQRPGPENALGRMKFMMPNPYAVYLHDTPSRELFRKQERTFSSGCVRLADPPALAQWLLTRDNHPQARSVDKLVASGETATIYLKSPVPTYIVYFTAFADDEGNVIFRRDIYGRDRVLIEALQGLRL
ncbi:MAG: L,D-transpeptidase family protein [Woeseiaceae bacterium]|nr:L,D-transpeptidase family protein [Woeseiaceae bacterium]